MATELDQWEVEDSMAEDKVLGRVQGYRIFEVPVGQVDDLKIYVEIGELHPDFTGLNAPRVWRRRVRRNPPGRKGWGRIEAFYRPPLWREPDASHPIRGVLTVRIGGSSEKLLVDKNGLVIEGETGVAAERRLGVRYKVIEGDNTVLTPMTDFVIVGIGKEIDVTKYESLVGKTNDAVIFYGAGGIGTVLFLSMKGEPPRAEDEHGYWNVELYFKRDPRGWNDKLKVQKWLKQPTKIQVKDASGNNVAGEYSRVMIDQPYSADADVEDRDLGLQVDFSVFKDMIEEP